MGYKDSITNKVKPHIVHILGSLGAGGAERLVLNLAIHPKLQHFQHSVVCSLSDQGQFRGKFKEAGIPIYFCPVRWPKSTPIPSYRFNRWLRNRLIFTFHWRFSRLLKYLKANLVHTHLGSYVGLQASAVISSSNLPFIWTIHGLYRSCGEKDMGLMEAFRLIKGSEKAIITAVSQAALVDVVGGIEMPAHKMRVIYNGVDLSQFRISPKRGKNWRTQWGIPSNAVVFGAAGRLIPIKRFDMLLEASAQVIANYPNVHVVIAGEGSLRQVLEEQIKRLGLQFHVHLVGYQSDMVQFWNEVDVAVISSDSEGFPMVVLEACAAGIPVIATRVGGIPEVLTDDTGILVEPGSPSLLAQAMMRMLDPSVRAEYGRRARENAERFSMDKIAAQYDSLYRELLGISFRGDT